MARPLLLALTLAVVGGVVWLLLGPGGEDTRGPESAERSRRDATEAPQLAGTAAASDGEAGAAPGRTAAAGPDLFAGMARVVGRVLRPDGAPAEGASVRWTMTAGRELTQIAEEKAGRDGRFVLRWMPLRPVRIESRVVAFADGYLFVGTSLPAEASASPTDVGDLVLREGPLSIAGRVLGAGDSPVAATVVIEREERQPAEPGWSSVVAPATTDATGVFAFAGLPPGRYRLRISHLRTYVREHVAAGTTDLVIRLPESERSIPTFPVLVRVRFAEVADAHEPEVHFFQGPGWEVPAPREGENRRLTVVGEPPATILVQPQPHPPANARWMPAVLRRVEPRAEPYDVLLRVGHVLRGRVVAAGKPVAAQVILNYSVDAAGAAVPEVQDAALRTLFPHEATIETDEEGRFEFPGLPAGHGTLRVDPSDANVADLSPPPARTVALGGSADLVVELEPSVTMRLDLRWPDGEPLPQDGGDTATVQVWGDDLWWGGSADTEVLGFEGNVLRLVVRKLRRGRPIDVLVHVGAVWGVGEHLVPREEPHAIGLRAPPRIRGTVLDPEGLPVRDAEVNVYMPQDADQPPYVAQGAYLRTDAEGRFEARPATPGRYTVVARDAIRDLRSVPVVVEAGSPPLELRLAPIERIHGRVVGREGEVLEGFSVRIVAPGADPSQASSRTCTADGFFELPWPGGERARLEARAMFSPTELRCATQEIGRDDEDVLLVLRAGGSITGLVRDASGSPVSGQVLLRGTWTWHVAAIGPDGRFAAGGLSEPVLDATVVTTDGRRLRRRVTTGDVDLVVSDR